MELKKLDYSFYTDNPVVLEALDFDTSKGEWMAGDKVRGHGIVQIELKGLVFAIPVRSNIQHDASLILEVSRGQNRRVKGMGLDYTKAVLIRKPGHVSSAPFLLKTKEAGRKLQGKEDHVTKQFTRYVEKYVKAVQNQDRHILNSADYRFTTLINYHAELGLL
ncbi:type III toxin-antitoxin system TenpIN family toxin [Pantoea agglomerans]